MKHSNFNFNGWVNRSTRGTHEKTDKLTKDERESGLYKQDAVANVPDRSNKDRCKGNETRINMS